MVPLILLALGLGAALTMYEFFPRTRARVDSYARAIRSAHAAHRTADARLNSASAATATAAQARQVVAAKQAAARPRLPPSPMQQPVPTRDPAPAPTWDPAPTWPPAPAPTPVPSPSPVQDVVDAAAASQAAADAATDAAVDHVTEANAANQDAAQSTADAAQSAETEAERQTAAQSAARVLEREKKIAQAFANLGVGQCGVRSYTRITPRVKDALLARLRSEGMAVAGSNPWNINTRQYDVKLRAVWDPKGQVLKLIVTSGKGGYLGLVTCAEIWKKIDPIMREITGG